MDIRILMAAMGFILAALFLRHYVEKIKIPYPIFLVVLGFLFSSFFSNISLAFTLNTFSLRPLFQYLFVPIFIYTSTMKIDFDAIKYEKITVILLGFILSIVMICIVGFVLYDMTKVSMQISWTVAFLIASILVSITAETLSPFFKQSGKHRLYALLQAETVASMLVSLVFFQTFLKFMLNPAILAPDIMNILAVLLTHTMGGFFLALMIGGLTLGLLNINRDTIFQAVITVFAIYLAYLVAEQFHASGAVAISSIALLFTIIGRWLEKSITYVFIDEIWGTLNAICYTALYLLLGMHIHINQLIAYIPQIIGLFVLILVIRAIFVYIFIPAFTVVHKNKLTFHDKNIIFFGGVRGVLPALLVLGFPQGFPAYSFIQSLIIGVLILSIFIQLPSLWFFVKERKV